MYRKGNKKREEMMTKTSKMRDILRAKAAQKERQRMNDIISATKQHK